jgi:hypothetical protein
MWADFGRLSVWSLFGNRICWLEAVALELNSLTTVALFKLGPMLHTAALNQPWYMMVYKYPMQY